MTSFYPSYLCRQFGTRERCFDCVYDIDCASCCVREGDSMDETPSPDVMEVWRAARYASLEVEGAVDWVYVTDADIASTAQRANQAAATATAIAEAKARWEREALERAAQAGYVACAETRHVTLGDKVVAAIRALSENSQ